MKIPLNLNKKFTALANIIFRHKKPKKPILNAHLIESIEILINTNLYDKLNTTKTFIIYYNNSANQPLML